MSKAVTQQAVKCWTEAGWSGDGGAGLPSKINKRTEDDLTAVGADLGEQE